jgi:hypothetical protein
VVELLQASLDWLRANWELSCLVCALAVIHAAEAWALMKLARAMTEDACERENDHERQQKPAQGQESS